VTDTELSSPGAFRLGEWLVQPSLNRITRRRSTLTLEQKVMDVLVCLTDHAGELVTRQQLIDAVWATEHISENVLTRAITELRSALGDDAKSPGYIETIHRKGYRLVAPVELLGDAERRVGREDSTGRPKLPYVFAVAIAAGTVSVFLLRPGALFERGSERPTEGALPRIVVLPFDNLGSPDDEYFADGISDEISSRLAAVSGLQVISRSSAMYYKGRHLPIRQVGDELDVDFVLEGTIRWDRTGSDHGRVRITPQLSRVADDTHLWSESYDRMLEDIFTVQSDIAEKVIDWLETTLLEPERRVVEARPTDNMEAYQAYLLGFQYMRTSFEMRYALLAVEMLERAVRLDPEFAVAHAELCRAHSRLYHHRLDFTPERLKMARVSAERARELQPGLPQGYLAFGWYHYLGFRDYDRAHEQFAKAAEALPNDAEVRAGNFYVLRRQGRWDETLDALERWLRVDPQGYLVACEASSTYSMLRKFEKAEEEIRRAIAIAPDLPDAYSRGASNYVQWDGATKRARRLLESAPSLNSPTIESYELLLDHFDRKPTSAMARLKASSINVYSLQRLYEPRELLECRFLSEMGDGQRASESCKSAVELLEHETEVRPHDHRVYSALGQAFAIFGRKGEAVRAGEHAVELMPLSKDALDGAEPAIQLAQIYARVGETDRALDLVEELLSIPCKLSVGLLRLDPAWDPLRDHPRFQALLEKFDTN
jgi:TolB-like protein/Flp pilus assembly protein TadD